MPQDDVIYFTTGFLSLTLVALIAFTDIEDPIEKGITDRKSVV